MDRLNKPIRTSGSTRLVEILPSKEIQAIDQGDMPSDWFLESAESGFQGKIQVCVLLLAEIF
jgi:hypothetical protein